MGEKYRTICCKTFAQWLIEKNRERKKEREGRKPQFSVYQALHPTIKIWGESPKELY